jgi:hypothetical protein
MTDEQDAGPVMPAALAAILNDGNWKMWPGSPTFWTKDVGGCEIVVACGASGVFTVDIQAHRRGCTKEGLDFAFEIRDRITAEIDRALAGDAAPGAGEADDGLV